MTEQELVAVVSGMFGLAVGSFLNVVIYRVPRKESIVVPRSHCTSCEKQLRNRDTIPVVSWLFLRGRCHNCCQRISVRYPIVEIVTGVLSASIGYQFGFEMETIGILIFAWGLIAISFIDLATKLIPKIVFYPVTIATAIPLTLHAFIKGEWTLIVNGLIGGVSAFTIFFVIAWIMPQGLGFGDVRLSFLLGMVLGYLRLPYVFSGFFMAFMYGTLYALVIVAMTRKFRNAEIPFGPWLAAGAMTAVLAGAPLTRLILPALAV